MKKFSSTMRASSRRTSRKERMLLIAAGTLAAVLLLVLVPRVVGFAAATIMVPVVKMQHWLKESAGVLPTYLRDRSSLLKERDSLQTQLTRLRDADLSIRRLEAENQSLRELFDTTTEPRLMARVISQPPLVPYDVLVIDKGSRDGIIKDAPVYAADGRVIGVVSAVYSTSALVVLVTMPGFESTVFILGPDIYTTAVGQGGGALRVEVPQGILLEKGNLVLLPAFSGGIFGEIVSIDAPETRPAQFGYVSLAAALQQISTVSIGTRPMTPVSFEQARADINFKIQELTTVPVPEGILVEPPDVASSTATTTSTISPTGI